jgi:AcrR family transcriptional regulator
MVNKTLSKKGEETKKRIIKAAIKIFKENGFKNSSVLKIAEIVGLKNSTLYRYFKNKKDLYNFIIRDFEKKLIKRVNEKLQPHIEIEKRVEVFIEEYIKFIKENKDIFDIFREAEFVNIDLSREFYDKVTGILNKILKDKVHNDNTEILSYSIIGSIYFLILNYIFWERKDLDKEKISSILYFIFNGIDKKGDFKPYLLKEKDYAEDYEKKEFSTKGEKTKELILKSSEKLFGKKGYSNTHISEIAKASKVGIGTIYLYFKTKKDILLEVVHFINKSLRDYINIYIKDYTDRRDIENAGFQAFFFLFKNMGFRYRIVRESEFVDRETGIWYYKRLAIAYTKRLTEGIEKGIISDINPEILSYSLMGIGHTIGMKEFVFKKNGEIDKNTVLTVLNFIMHGLNYFIDGG